MQKVVMLVIDKARFKVERTSKSRQHELKYQEEYSNSNYALSFDYEF